MKKKDSKFLAKDGEEALQIFYDEKIDLAILDWMMPKHSGITVCQEIKNSSVKVLMLTAKSESEDELARFKVGQMST